ncbi:hypothetical protein ACS0TY_020839 [Phlomoides rotata]
MLSTGLSRFLPPGSKSNPDAQTRTPRRKEDTRPLWLSPGLPTLPTRPPPAHHHISALCGGAPPSHTAHPHPSTLVARAPRHRQERECKEKQNTGGVARRNRTPSGTIVQGETETEHRIRKWLLTGLIKVQRWDSILYSFKFRLQENQQQCSSFGCTYFTKG